MGDTHTDVPVPVRTTCSTDSETIKRPRQNQSIVYLLRKIEALETAAKLNYNNLARRFCAIESILLKQFGSTSIVDAENIVKLLDENIMSLRPSPSSSRRPTTTSLTNKIPTSSKISEEPLKKSLAGPSSSVIKIEQDSGGYSSSDYEDNALSNTNDLWDDSELEEQKFQVETKTMTTNTVTRSGRLSKQSSKFKMEMDMESNNDEVDLEDVEFVSIHPEPNKIISTPSDDTLVPIVCTICGIGMASTTKLRAHRRKCRNESRNWKFPCEICKKMFRTEFKRNYHRKLHTEIRPYHCEVPGCESAFKYNTQLTIHRRVHQSIKKYSCTACGNTYKHKSGLDIHMLTHKQLRIYGCVFCEKKFYTRTHVKRHIRQFHKCVDKEFEIPKDVSLLPPPPPKKDASLRPKRGPRRVERVVCDQCGACVLRNNFKHHLATHELLFNCDQCGKGFSTEFAVKSHVSQAHDLDKPFLCNYPDCESRFNSISNLKTHQLKHTEDRRYRCEPCNRSYKHKGGLQVHINSCHSKDKQFPCSVCERVFDTRTHLKRHVMKVHKLDKDEAEILTKVDKPVKLSSGPERVPCDMCPKTYKNRHDLRLHQNAVHTHETQYPCEYCPKVFYRRNHHKRHLQKIHRIEPGDKPEVADKRIVVLPNTSKQTNEPLEPKTVVEVIEYDGEEIEEEIIAM